MEGWSVCCLPSSWPHTGASQSPHGTRATVGQHPGGKVHVVSHAVTFYHVNILQWCHYPEKNFLRVFIWNGFTDSLSYSQNLKLIKGLKSFR